MSSTEDGHERTAEELYEEERRRRALALASRAGALAVYGEAYLAQQSYQLSPATRARGGFGTPGEPRRARMHGDDPPSAAAAAPVLPPIPSPPPVPAPPPAPSGPRASTAEDLGPLAISAGAASTLAALAVGASVPIAVPLGIAVGLTTWLFRKR
jgi:hypothetical protein